MESDDAVLDRMFASEAPVATAEPVKVAEPVKEAPKPVEPEAAKPVAQAAAPVVAPTQETPAPNLDREAAMLAIRRAGVDPALYGSNEAAMFAAAARFKASQAEFDRTKAEVGELRKKLTEPQSVTGSTGVLTPDVDLAAKEFAKQLGSEEFEGPLKQFGGALSRHHAQESAALRAALAESNALLGEVMTTGMLDGMTKDFPGLSDGSKRSAVREKAMALVGGGGYESAGSKMDQVRAALTDAAVLLLGRTQADAARDAGQPTVPGTAAIPKETLNEDQLVDAIADAAANGRRDEVARFGALLAERRRKR